MTAAKKKTTKRKREKDVPEEEGAEPEAVEHVVEAEEQLIDDPGAESAQAGSPPGLADEAAVSQESVPALPAEARMDAPVSAIEPARSAAQVLAASSEEFRDPLQTIHGALELLVAGKVPDERQAKKFLGIAFRETSFLSHRVSDLHIASLIEVGKLRLRLTTLDLARILDETIQESGSMAADQAITIEFAPAGSLPTLQGDKALLRKLFTNLVEKAVKSAPRDGALWIQASAEEGRVHLRLQSQAGADAERPPDRPAGLDQVALEGLALYVAERIAAAHDGTLRALGSGKHAEAFELTLPLQPTGPKRGLVLVVDDNPQAAVLLEYALQEEGFEAIKAMNGLEGLKLARSEKVDLMILDVLLPGLDGFEVCHRLRSNPETASIPVIMISAKARDEDRATALRIGADAYFGKPLGMAELMVAIEDLLENGG